MKQAWKDGFPAVFAVWVLLIGIITDLLGIVPLKQLDKFENISNVSMIIIAIAGLLWFFFKQMDDGKKLFHILNNVAVSGFALCMNVYVFRHTIRSEHLWQDIWGVHLLWLLFATAQILLLSGLGRIILNVIHSLLRDVKKLAVRLWEAVYDLINHTDNYVLCALLGSLIGWNIYIGIQVHTNGIKFILEDTDIFSQSVWLWTISLLIFLLVRIFPLIIQKVIKEIEEIKGHIMLVAISVITLVMLSYALPSFLMTVVALVLISLAAICILYFSIRKISQLANKLGNSTPRAATVEESEGKRTHTIRYSDLIIVILVFALPLATLLITASLQPEARAVLTEQDSLNIDTLLKFMGKVLEIAVSLLKLLE